MGGVFKTFRLRSSADRLPDISGSSRYTLKTILEGTNLSKSRLTRQMP